MRSLLGLVALLATGGCAGGPGRVELGHYTSEKYPLEVVAHGTSAASAGLMPEGWKLDNFYGDPVPDTAKESDAYRTLYHFDVNGDGENETKTREFSFDLRFTSFRDDGVVWLRVVPVSRDMADVALPVLVDGYVEGLAGGNYETVALGADRSVSYEKRYASTLVTSQPCRLGQLDCQIATIEIADVDQLKLSPTYRSRRLEVLFARSGFVYSALGVTFPTFLIAGYSNQPARFDSGISAFRDLLQRIVVERRRGFELLPGSVPIEPAAMVAPPTLHVAPAASSPPAGPPSSMPPAAPAAPAP